MSLECLLVVRDPNLQRILTQSLAHAGIHVEPCASPERAIDRLQHSKFDAVMVDCVEVDEAPEVLRRVRQAPPNRYSLVFAIVDREATPLERAETGANFLLERPILPEMLTRVLRAARGLMEQERRRYFRYPVETVVSLADGRNEVRATATNISSGGMALQLEKSLEQGWRGDMEFKLRDPDLHMAVKGEVVWVSAARQAGIRFTHVPLSLRQPFETWIAARGRSEKSTAHVAGTGGMPKSA
jgi:CheY-like chemotaxis protein